MNNNTNEVEVKVCNKCKKEKLLTADHFGKNKANKSGFNVVCKICKNEYGKKYRERNKEYFHNYREENREYYQEYNKKHYKNNKEYHRRYVEENKEHRKRYFEGNREQITKYHREYYRENKVGMQEKSKGYYENNKENILEKNKKYRKDNRHILNQSQQRRRAVKKKLPCTLTIEQWVNVKIHFNNSCSYCGMFEEEHVKAFKELLHQDHFIPLDNGGEYTHNNIVPACRSCNSSKNNANFFEWYPRHKHYNQKREKIILEYLGYKNNIQQLSIL